MLEQLHTCRHIAVCFPSLPGPQQAASLHNCLFQPHLSESCEPLYLLASLCWSRLSSFVLVPHAPKLFAPIMLIVNMALFQKILGSSFSSSLSSWVLSCHSFNLAILKSAILAVDCSILGDALPPQGLTPTFHPDSVNNIVLPGKR